MPRWLYQTLKGEGGWEKRKLERAKDRMESRHDFVEKKTRRDAVEGLLMFVHVWINCIAIDLTHFLSDNEAALWAASSQNK
jgi:hypothetical protein